MKSFRPMAGERWLSVVVLGAGLAACGATYTAADGGSTAAMRGDTTMPWGATDGLRCVPNVSVALRQLERYGTPFGFYLGNAEPVGGYGRHWQGVQRFSGSNATYLFVSRSGSPTAVLIASLGSRPAGGGPLGASWSPQGLPPTADRVVARIPFDSGYDHAGGLALSGTMLAVPMDGEGRSQIVFYDVSRPEQPQRLSMLDHSDARRPSTPGVASAVALSRLADGRYLLILGVRSSKILEFYVSDHGSLQSSGLVFHKLGIRLGQEVGGFQNLSVLTQCDGTLHLVGTHNTAMPPPSLGRDHVHWYRLESDASGRILFRKEGERWLYCTYCNLAAAAGLYVTPTGDVLLYATGFWTRTPGTWVAVEEFTSADKVTR